ncbi:MAG TPA: hypothetical protein VM369_02480 [Candidatus Binatia bacterium]|nr:hypothetical protein [Candidatus Binatia bacterium]
MNDLDLERETELWFGRAGEALRESEQQLDAVTLMRLRAIRARALAEARPVAARHAANWAVPLAAAAGLATWALLPRLMVAPGPVAGPAEVASVDALDLMTDEHGPDFYRDLEFYAWLQARGEHA